MLLVESLLLGAAAIRLLERALHAVRDPVGIEDRAAVQIARGAADRLNERAVTSQKTLLVRVQNRNERDFRNVEAFAQEVDPDEDVEGARAQIADDLHALDRVDVGVEIAHLHAVLGEEVREILGHALRERRHEDALALLRHLADFGEKIVHLRDGGTIFSPKSAR